MTNQILITDSLFIFPEHEEMLRSSGYTIDRLDKPKASEDELRERIRGKIGYILGGIERVTSPVIQAADRLKVISFTGSGYSEFIPAHEDATRRGIKITAAVGGNARAVAEYALSLILMMARKIPVLTNERSNVSFVTVPGVEATTLGIIGLGHIGKNVAELARAVGFKVLLADNGRNSMHNLPGDDRLPLEEVLRTADIVTIHVSKARGRHVLDADGLNLLRDGAGIVNVAFPEAVDEQALKHHLLSKRLYAAFDAGYETRTDFPPGHFLQSNAQTAFNTALANKQISEMAVRSLLNVLGTGTDPYVVN